MYKRIFFLSIFNIFLINELMAATSQTLRISGTVTTISQITVTANTAASSLNLNGAATDVLVGVVNELSNNRTGYKITVSSLNNSILKGATANNTDKVTYTFKYGGTTIDISNSAATAVVVTNTTAKTSKDGTNKEIKVSYANPGFINADSYADTLTFTILSNS